MRGSGVLVLATVAVAGVASLATASAFDFERSLQTVDGIGLEVLLPCMERFDLANFSRCASTVVGDVIIVAPETLDGSVFNNLIDDLTPFALDENLQPTLSDCEDIFQGEPASQCASIADLDSLYDFTVAMDAAFVNHTECDVINTLTASVGSGIYVDESGQDSQVDSVGSVSLSAGEELSLSKFEALVALREPCEALEPGITTSAYIFAPTTAAPSAAGSNVVPVLQLLLVALLLRR